MIKHVFGLTSASLLPGLICSLILWVSGAGQSVVAATGEVQAIRLLNLVDTNSEINVIVTMAGSAAEAVVPPADGNDSQRRAAVGAAQEALLGGLARADYQVRRRFEYVPQIALRVNRRALQVLLSNPDMQVVESRPRRTSLAQSVPRIYPNHVSSQYTGMGWTVAVLDTGVDRNHAFLGGRIVNEACFSTSDTTDGTTTLCPNGSTIQYGTGAAAPCTEIDGCDHGTHVAGIAAGDGASFDGVARQANLIAIQVFSQADDTDFCDPDPAPCAVSYPEDIIEGLGRVYSLRNSYNIASVNMSLGAERDPTPGDCSTEPEKPMIDLLRATGIAAVVASGNGGDEAVDAPACVAGAIAVGSTPDNADTRSSYSNNGPALDLYAPGDTITSSVPGGSFGDKAGTSMSTAHVSGAWAVIKQLSPSASVSQVEATMKGAGPLVSSNGVTRRRIDIDSVLCVFDNSIENCSGNIGSIVPILQLLLL